MPNFYRDPHRDHWGRINTDATAPFRRDEFVRKRIPGAEPVDLATWFDVGRGRPPRHLGGGRTGAWTHKRGLRPKHLLLEAKRKCRSVNPLKSVGVL